MLPIHDVLDEVLATLADHPAVVVHAPTGAGKTTALPPAVLDAGLAGDGAIWVLEPRRIAARSAARHVARLRGGRPGDEVGWHVRFEPRFTAATRLLYLTDGTAVRRIQSDPFLDGVGVVVFDEFHERALPTDLALAMVRRVQREIRDDLKLVVMSATLDATRVSAFLDGAPIVASQGRSYPVDVRYRPRPDDRYVTDRAADGVREALSAATGDVLAFLPGVGEIQGTAEALADQRDIDVLPLHGRLRPEAQDRALRRGPRRRVVLATNVAETSLTLDGIEAVVDTGLARILRHDPGSGLDRLVLEPISQASADQRAGRAGRQAPGLCLRLWTEREHRARPAHDTPALQRTDLAGPVLQLRSFGEPDPAAFPWVEPPPPEALAAAEALLADLGLVADGLLTPRGEAAAALPVHPRLGVLLLEAAAAGHPGLGALAAAALAERDPFGRPRDPVDATPSDVLERAHALRTGRDRRLRPGAREPLMRVAERLRRLVADHPATEPLSDGDEAVMRAIATAWADRIALRRGPRSERGRMRGGRGVRLEGSGVREGVLFACVQADDSRAREARVRIASAVDPSWVPVEERVEVGFDEERRQVVARRVRAFDDLVLEAHPAPLPDPATVSARLQQAVDAEALPWDEEPAATLLARLHHAAATLPRLDLPTPDAAFRASLVPPLCIGRRGLDELDADALAQAVRDHLGWAGTQALDREAPERLQVPSGSAIRLRWALDGPPVLAVRMQELFGLADTPRVLGGRVPVRLHLLAPNMRPQQITDDLASFWANTWADVRKDLRARYPKHAWPEDPLSATPLRGAKRRR